MSIVWSCMFTRWKGPKSQSMPHMCQLRIMHHCLRYGHTGYSTASCHEDIILPSFVFHLVGLSTIVYELVSKAESGWWRHGICWLAIVVCCALFYHIRESLVMVLSIMYALLLSVNFNWSKDIFPTSLIYQAIIALWLTKLISRLKLKSIMSIGWNS